MLCLMTSSEPSGAGNAGRSRLDADGVGQLARMARLPLSPERAAAHVERLEGFLAFADEWEDLGLAFSFEDGRFDYAPSIAQFRPEWQLRTKLNKQRAILPEDDIASEQEPER